MQHDRRILWVFHSFSKKIAAMGDEGSLWRSLFISDEGSSIASALAEVSSPHQQAEGLGLTAPSGLLDFSADVEATSGV